MELVDTRYYTLQEIADRLQVSWRTVNRWVQSGALPALKLGGEWRVAESDMAQFLEERKTRRED